MTAADLMLIVKEFGFPVLVAFALGWYVMYQNRECKAERKEDRDGHLAALKDQNATHGAALKDLSDSLVSAIEKMGTGLDRNTAALDSFGRETLRALVSGGK